MLEEFDVTNIDYEDKKTWDLICAGRTKGVFQLESNLGKSWAKRLKPKNIGELAALVALLRPGCLKAIVDGKSMTQHYVDRKHGKEQVTYLHDSLEPILESTQGVLVYQEQSMEIAQVIAGFNLQEADNLRKAIGKKKADLMIEVKKRFFEGAENENIVPRETAEEIFSWIEKSNRYAFNKSHAVSYAICAYWSAYAKAHFPLKFYCQYLHFADGKQDPQQEVKELVIDAKVNDIFIQPPSLQHINEDTDIVDGQIYFGFKNIKSIGSKQIIKLKEETLNAEKYLKKQIDNWSWFDFLINLSMNIHSSTAIAIISLGIVPSSNMSRTKMLDEFDTWKKLTKLERSWIVERQSGWSSLLDALVAVAPTKKESGGTSNVNRSVIVHDFVRHTKDPSFSLSDDPEWITRTEERYLGVPLTYSKVESCDTSMADTTCKEFLDGKKGKMKLAVTLTDIRKYTIKKGKSQGKDMAFLCVEDQTGSVDSVTIFPEELQKYKEILYDENTVILSCATSRKSDYDGMVVENVFQI